MCISFNEDVQLHRNEQINVYKTDDDWAVCLRMTLEKMFEIFYFIFIKTCFE